jgi:hypothetical protein
MRQLEFQLNEGNQTQFDPPVIPTGRRLKTSACLRFWPCFSESFAKFSPLKFSPLSKSLDPEVIKITLTP